MLAKEKLDAVSICTYNRQHACCAIDALNAGVNVLLEKPFTVTIEEAAEVISSDLTVEQSAIALIPTSGGSEVRCYEFLCKNAKGNELLIYINTKTLESEQIFTLLKTDGGTLVK